MPRIANTFLKTTLLLSFFSYPYHTALSVQTSSANTASTTAKIHFTSDTVSCTPDIDGNNNSDALSDGLLFIRWLFGFTGTALTDNAVAGDATRSDAAAILEFLNSPSCQLMADVDGNGTADALTDGLLFIRWLFGFTGDALINNAIGSGATRTDSAEIESFLAGFTATISSDMAARFLTQASFGPTQDSIQALLDLGGYEAWLNDQFDSPFVAQLPVIKSLTEKMCHAPEDGGLDTWFSPARYHVWWDNAVNGNDQLRQRVAFALSQIVVVSENAPALSDSQYGLGSYYDMLLEHAFGNYRDLLEAVSRHPAMGIYLSSVRNERADPEKNIRPDENYARELKQLLSIGPHLLNMDGSFILDANQQPIPSYAQSDIETFARVFTGWNFANIDWQEWPGNGDVTLPMLPWEFYHDKAEKQLLNGAVLPANQSALQDMQGALDNLFNHPNIAPFISKQLIKRLVTSNPTPAYVERVAMVFNNNGLGVRGDLKAVVRAILLDIEARTGHTTIANFGKLREPVLRFTHLWRAFNAQPITLSGRFWDHDVSCGQPDYQYYRVWWGLYDFSDVVGQAPLAAPSVFNFFLPDYSPPGVVRDQSLVAPEFQLATDNYVINTANAINSQIQETSSPEDNWQWVTLDLTTLAASVANADELLDLLDIVLLNGQMSQEMRQIILDHINNSPFPENEDENRLAKTRDIIMLIVNSPAYLIQK